MQVTLNPKPVNPKLSSFRNVKNFRDLGLGRRASVSGRLAKSFAVGVPGFFSENCSEFWYVTEACVAGNSN